jgi:hypothetical protein
MFHHARDAIEAHLTIVFAALAIFRRLQDQSGMSIKKGRARCAGFSRSPSAWRPPPHRSRPLTDASRDILIATCRESTTHETGTTRVL